MHDPAPEHHRGPLAESVRRDGGENCGQTGATAIESLVADLSSQDQVRRLAEEVRERCDRLDVLVNNAGGMFLDRRESVDGIELTLVLNHLSYFVLTNQLLPLLEGECVLADRQRRVGCA